MNSRDKSRYFTFLLYRDSAPSNYLELLESLNIPMALSPWHDQDVKTKNFTPGEQKLVAQGKVVFKKEHRHCIYIANNPVTANAVRNRLQRLFAKYTNKPVVSHVQIITTSVENTYAYLTHESKDAIAKHKHVYDSKDIVLLSNFDLSRYQVFDTEEQLEVLVNIIGVVKTYGFANVIELQEFVDNNENAFSALGIADFRQFVKVVKGNSGLLRLYFDGNYQRRKNGK
ncbi:Rep family protein [Ligilactobacillus agilis]|uniref:Rep family protein n=1 Tax=Ligilactobacillus agilis TaxID=1601 RepID=UPI00177AD200|nr:Rep family protein [Ligilactobacillus agilis]